MNPKKNTPRKTSRGFTLMEVLVVVVLLGLLASIVIGAFKNSEREAASTVFAHDVRAAVSAFHAYWLQNGGTFPADRGPGITPPEITNYLGRMTWSEDTAIGGKWDWDQGVYGVSAAMSVSQPDRTPVEMAKIDAIIDDGNLLTGNFRVREGGYMFVIKE